MSEATAPVEEGQPVEAGPEDAGQAQWYDTAPDELKGYVQNKGWDDPLKAVEAYQNLEKFHGVPADQLIKLPKELDDMESLLPVYDKLGRPESPDGYSFEAPEGVMVDENRVNMAREVAHKAGLNEQQFKALVDMDMQYTQQFMEQYQAEQQKMEQAEFNELQKEWGEGYNERVEMARRFINETLPEGVDKTAAMNAIQEAIGFKATMKLFANAADKSTNREGSLPDTSGDRPYGYTKEQATYERSQLMQEIQGDDTRLKNYNNGIGPDIDKMKRLNQIISG